PRRSPARRARRAAVPRRAMGTRGGGPRVRHRRPRCDHLLITSDVRDAMTHIDTAGKTLWQLICERAALTPDKRMAIDEQGRTMTYGEYKAWAERTAAGLAQH